MSEASDQITEYLSVGGLFNPEMMNQTQHEAVRDTLIKARDDIQRLESENAALRERLEQLQDFAVLVLRGLDSGYIRSKPFIDTSDDNATEYPVRTLEDIARAALARKEVQP